MNKEKMKKEEKVEKKKQVKKESKEDAKTKNPLDSKEEDNKQNDNIEGDIEKEEKSKSDEVSLEDQLNDSKDKYLRLSAEFDNYRKRTLKEKMELTKTAGKDILEDFLGIMDDFERALINSEKGDSVEHLKEGLSLIYNKCQGFLKKNGVKEIEARESDFDVELHEAVTKIPAPADELKGKVVDVIQKGYMIDDKVLRYSKVVVGE